MQCVSFLKNMTTHTKRHFVSDRNELCKITSIYVKLCQLDRARLVTNVLRRIFFVIRLAQPTNIEGFDVFKLFGKSLMYSKKRMGTRFDPCGTPYLISFTDDFLPLIEQTCFLVCNLSVISTDILITILKDRCYFSQPPVVREYTSPK